MAEVNYIRHETNIKGKKYAEMARKVGVDWRTVKKYSDKEDFSLKTPVHQTRKSPVMDPVKPIIDEWLREDAQKKKKFRRTAKRIHTLLKEHHDFAGSDRSVRDYVAKRKRELAEESEDASLPLVTKPGAAQVDFGEAPFLHRGKEVIMHYLILSFPASNAFVFQVFPSENRECFLQGLTNIFTFLGGVPHTIRFDNLSPAVSKILPNGERKLTEEFERFTAHYGFRYEFCNPNSGNEKGHVESMVKYVRNNYLIPTIPYQTLSDLNEQALCWSVQDRNRPHFEKGLPIAELYLADEQRLLQLPGKPYECIRKETLKADKYGYVRIDEQKYSTSPRFAGQRVSVRLSFDQVMILTDSNEVVTTHPRSYGDEKKTSMDWQPYLSLMAKRPTALKYTTFFEELPEEWRVYLEACTVEEKKSALRLLSILLKERDFSKPTEALRMASEHGHPSSDTIKHVYYQLRNGRGVRQTLSLPKRTHHLPMAEQRAERGLQHYDELMDGTGGDHS